MGDVKPVNFKFNVHTSQLLNAWWDSIQRLNALWNPYDSRTLLDGGCHPFELTLGGTKDITQFRDVLRTPTNFLYDLHLNLFLDAESGPQPTSRCNLGPQTT